MKLFECQNCGQLLYFENTRCERCGHVLGYIPDGAVLSALTQDAGDRWRPLSAPEQVYRFCANAAHEACNWLVPVETPDAFCRACRLNRTIPDLGPPEHLLRWQRLEAAKHRLVYSLLRLGLPLVSKFEDPGTGLAFDFLADAVPGSPDGPKIVTGHEHGLITINIVEADDAERERARQEMGEPYRTLLGHFRHEVGHYYWERLVRDGPWLAWFRTMFGDERQDYGACLQSHHAEGPPADWQQRFVSGYASAPTRGRTSPRPGRTTCTSWTRSRPPPPSVCASPPRPDAIPGSPWRSISIRTGNTTSTPLSKPGCRSPMRSTA
jgi:hypothetical protein